MVIDRKVQRRGGRVEGWSVILIVLQGHGGAYSAKSKPVTWSAATGTIMSVASVVQSGRSRSTSNRANGVDADQGSCRQ